MSHLLVFIQSTIQVVKGRNSYESNELQMLRVSLLPWSNQRYFTYLPVSTAMRAENTVLMIHLKKLKREKTC